MRQIQTGLEWVDSGLTLKPRWTFEPKLEQIERIVRQVLGLRENETCKVSFHAQGTFNRLYRIECSSRTLLLRASLPVDPNFKTRSEVATIRYVQEISRIPVPKIYAYSVDLKWHDDAGEMQPFEWILMEFMPGQPLWNRWRKLSMEAKSALVKEIAHFQIELLTAQLPSSGIGSIYFTQAYEQHSDHQGIEISITVSADRRQVTSRAFRLKEAQDGHGKDEQDKDWILCQIDSNQSVGSSTTFSSPKFKLGRIVSPEQFWGDRITKAIIRGPYRNSQDWLQVKLSLILSDQERIIEASEDEDEIEEASQIKRVAERLNALLPSVFLHEKWSPVRTALKHIDLSMQNVLVDDEGEITAIIDWECVSAVPRWLSSQLPQFLVGRDRLSRPEREEYADESEDAAEEAAEEGVDNEGKAPLYWIHLLEYELTALRQVYLNEMETSYAEWDTEKGMRGLVDFELAVSRCSTGLGLGIIEDWLDDWEEGNYWSLTERFLGMKEGMKLPDFNAGSFARACELKGTLTPMGSTGRTARWDSSTALQAASAGGHETVVKMLLDAGADVNAQGGEYGNALQAASRESHETVVKMLLDAGADVNAQGGYYGSALQAASAGGHETVVKMLLDAGADVNAQGGYYGSALQAASREGHETMVKMLLDAGADVNAQGGYYGTALQAASEGGHETVVKILLDARADANAQGGWGSDTALQVASERGHETIVKMLLGAGADANAQGGRYDTALRAASEGGHETVVKILLDAGANANAGGRYSSASVRADIAQDWGSGTALQVASERGHETIVKMLLDAGGGCQR
jgi:ankyrin repeat protein/aminoglycoside phosphotransferase (APT) family kinase protein